MLIYSADTYCPESTVSDGKQHITKKKSWWGDMNGSNGQQIKPCDEFKKKFCLFSDT